MTEYELFVRKLVKPADIIDAANTLPLGYVRTYSWFDADWCRPETYLEWAKAQLQRADEIGYDSAITYAKRVCARIIDGLVYTYYQMKTLRMTYPAKIERLEELGIAVPAIVHEWVFEPRNSLEHSYELASREDAEKAVQLAQLFVEAMRQETEKLPIVTIGWNVSGGESNSVKSGATLRFYGFAENPMFFIDVFDDPILVKVIHPRDAEIQYAPLEDFQDKECLMLGRKLHEHWSLPNRGES